MENPVLPGGLGTPSPLDKSLSCAPRIHSRVRALRPPSGVKDTVAWGSPVCRWEEPAIWMKSFHVRRNPPPCNITTTITPTATETPAGGRSAER